MAYALYRLYGDEDTLLYVGISMNLPARLTNHRVQKTWWASVRHIAVEHFDSRRAVLDAEREAIRSEHPLWNVQHRVGPPPEPTTPYQEAVELLFGFLPEVSNPARQLELAEEFDDVHGYDEYEDGSRVDYSGWPTELKALVRAIHNATEEDWQSANAVHCALAAFCGDGLPATMAAAREEFARNGYSDPTELEVERYALVEAARRTGAWTAPV